MQPSTQPEDVARPVELVTLRDLKTLDGTAVTVYVERVAEEALVDIMRQLPGEVPIEARADEDEAGREQRARRWLGWSQPLIERGTFVVLGDGTQVRPGFSWNGSGAAMRGSDLSAHDRTLLMTAILRLSGWTTETAAPAGFHAGERGGRERGAGAMDAGEGERKNPVGGRARRASRV